MLAVVLNAIMIIFVERVHRFRDAYEPDEIIKLIWYSGIVQGVSSGLLIFFYVITRGGLITKASWRQYVKKNKGIFKPFQNEERLDVTEMSIDMTHTLLMTKVIPYSRLNYMQGPEAPEFNLEGKLKFGNAFTRFEYYMYNVWFFIQDGKFIYYLLYFMVSLLAFFYNDVFYALHLLDFIVSIHPIMTENVVEIARIAECY